jgi:hypothetical protein
MRDAIMRAGRVPATRPGKLNSITDAMWAQLRLELSIPLRSSSLDVRVALPMLWLMEQS